MLRWIWAVPPQIVSEREKKNDACRSSTGIVGSPAAHARKDLHAFGVAPQDLGVHPEDVHREVHRLLVCL